MEVEFSRYFERRDSDEEKQIYVPTDHRGFEAGGNRTVRHKWLGQYLFADIKEVRDTATKWLWIYNNERPNMGLGGITLTQKLNRQMQTQTAA